MKKYSLIILLTVAGMACTKDLTSLNTDVKNPPESPSYALFTNAQKELMDVVTTPSQNLNAFRLLVQYWQQTIYLEESQYNLTKRRLADNWWNPLYATVLTDLSAARRVMQTDVKDETLRGNQEQIVEILQVVSMYYLVSTFGNVPYSEALDIDKPAPKYDDAATVYNDLVRRLDAAIAAIKTNAGSFERADVIYNGDMASWKRFAASFKLKMAMLIADSDPAKSKAWAQEAVQTGVFTQSGHSAVFQYAQTPPNANPIWVTLIQEGRDDFVPASTFVDSLLSWNDPRIARYMTEDRSGGYSGGDPGASSDFGSLSHVHGDIAKPDFPAVLMDYSEVLFLLAEAAQRGYAVGGIAADYYANAVRESFLSWDLSLTDAHTYLAQDKVKYDAANWKRSLGLQKWFAFFNRSHEAWTEWRRLDFPRLQRSAGSISDIPVRLRYPLTEQGVNKANFTAASTAIGGDKVTVKLWWDKF
ncbi:SusD/RagB family nutrient-binding outer membrane lipoprotein [Chitinophaga lutea]